MFFANGKKWLFKLFSASMVVMWNFNGMNPEVNIMYENSLLLNSNYIILKQTSYLTSMEVFYIKGFPNGSL